MKRQTNEYLNELPSKTKQDLAEPSINLVLLWGTIAQEPVVRVLASGDPIASCELITLNGQRSTSVPLVSSDGHLDSALTGSSVMVLGAVRRRFFRTGAVTQSRTEIQVQRVCAATDLAGVKAMCDSVAQRARSFGKLQASSG